MKYYLARRLNIFFISIIIVSINFLVFEKSAFAEIKEAVVKIFTTSNRMDFYRPWQSRGITNSVGSGFIVKGNKILTNAHVVSDYTFVQVKKSSDPRKYTAKVEAIGHDCDLALLTIEDDDFFDGIDPIKIGNLPNLQDQVTVIGFPKGGDKISFTKGVVSRIEITTYSQSGRKLLAVQIDAAINAGNSGGPVIRNSKLVGVAMQALQSSQNIGYMIPVPIINHFFDDLKDGTYDGYPVLGIDYGSTENPTLRDYFGIKNYDGGIIVSKVLPYSSAENNLQNGDIILEINEVPIAEDGTFLFRKGERLAMLHLITSKQLGEHIKIKIVRQKKIVDIKIKLKAFKPLVPYPHHNDKPTYYIYGGLVFSVLSSDLVQTWGRRWWEKAPLGFSYYLASTGRLNFKNREELVVLLNVLPDEVNIGYHQFGNDIIKQVNGEKINSFKQFVELLYKNKNQYTIIETEHNSKIILNRKQIEESSLSIIDRNNIPAPYSQDVKNWIDSWAFKNE